MPKHLFFCVGVLGGLRRGVAPKRRSPPLERSTFCACVALCVDMSFVPHATLVSSHRLALVWDLLSQPARAGIVARDLLRCDAFRESFDGSEAEARELLE